MSKNYSNDAVFLSNRKKRHEDRNIARVKQTENEIKWKALLGVTESPAKATEYWNTKETQ